MADDTTFHVPATVADMKEPKPSSIITEAANFQRAHYDEFKPYMLALSGEAPSIHGSFSLDEAACIFDMKRVATEDGYAYLGSLPTVKFRRAMRFGWRRNTGVPMRLLEKQYKRLQIEHQQH